MIALEQIPFITRGVHKIGERFRDPRVTGDYLIVVNADNLANVVAVVADLRSLLRFNYMLEGRYDCSGTSEAGEPTCFGHKEILEDSAEFKEYAKIIRGEGAA